MTSRWPIRSRPVVWIVLVAVGVYAWIAAGFRPFTTAEEVMVAIPAVIVLVVAAWQPSRPRSESRGTTNDTTSSRGSMVVWLVLVALAVAWELIAFFSSPRHDHPTLSIIADEIMSVHVGRAAMFALWLALGWSLVAHRRGVPR